MDAKPGDKVMPSLVSIDSVVLVLFWLGVSQKAELGDRNANVRVVTEDYL
jgi:hypothetical protein